MRYLKKFEGLESNSIIDINKLMEFCNNSLVYLLDEGFELDLQTRTGRFPELRTVRYNGEAGVNITCSSVDNYTWLKLKDYYIPFLRLLTRRYKLYPYYQPQRFDLNGNLIKKLADVFVALQGGNEYFYYSIEDLIEDNIDDNFEFYSLSVKVGKEL